jgi:hypothetical protein
MTKKKVRSSKHRELFSFFPLYFIFEKEEEPGYTWEYFLLLPFLPNPKRREFNFFYDFSIWILSGNNIYFNQSPHATLYRPMMSKGPAMMSDQCRSHYVLIWILTTYHLLPWARGPTWVFSTWAQVQESKDKKLNNWAMLQDLEISGQLPHTHTRVFFIFNFHSYKMIPPQDVKVISCIKLR